MVSRFACLLVCASVVLGLSGPAAADSIDVSGYYAAWDGDTFSRAIPELQDALGLSSVWLQFNLALPYFFYSGPAGAEYTGPEYHAETASFSLDLLTDQGEYTIATGNVALDVDSGLRPPTYLDAFWVIDWQGACFAAEGLIPVPDLGVTFGMSDFTFFSSAGDGTPALAADLYDATLTYEINQAPQPTPRSLPSEIPPQIVPEPSTCLLLGAGLLGLCARATRRARD